MIKIITKPSLEVKQDLKPIFFEPTGIRWKISKVLIVLITAFSILISVALVRYYFNSFNSNNILTSYANDYSKEVSQLNNTINTHAFYSPDYTSGYTTGAIKENVKNIKHLIINPFKDDKLSKDGGFLSSLEFYTTNNPNPTSLFFNKRSQAIGIDRLINNKEFESFLKKVKANAFVFEIEDEDNINRYQELGKKLNIRIDFLINRPALTILNFKNSVVYYQLIPNDVIPFNEQSNQFIDGYNKLTNSAKEIRVTLPSQYQLANSAITKIVPTLDVQRTIKKGDKITFKNNIPNVKIGTNDINLYGKWYYFNLLTSFGEKLPAYTSLGLSSVENAESDSLTFLINKKLETEFILSNKIISSGNGLIQNIKSYGTKGSISADTNNGYLTLVKIESIPVQAEIEYTGQESKTTALTFDDGPAVINSPKVLKLLDEYKVKGTFFVTGQQIQKHPDTLIAIAKAGHQIENHTYSHPYLTKVTEKQIDWELSETNRLIKLYTGNDAKFLRVPFDAYGVPQTTSDLKINQIAERHNLKLYQIDTDVKDFGKVEGSLEADVKVDFDNLDNIKTQILFHDGPDLDRTKSIEQLENLLEKLSSANFKLVTVNYYVSKDTQAVIPTKEQPWYEKILSLNSSNADVLVYSYNGLINLFLFIGSISVIFFIGFLFRNKYLAAKEDFFADVTAVVPCYNEEKNVINTVQSLLDNDIPNLKILVVDDGSKDTSFIKLKIAFSNNPRVKIVTKPNGGKSTALNYGLTHVDTEYFVTMDSDTIFSSDSVRLMMRHFKDPRVSAVAGNVQVGNEYFNMKKTDPNLKLFKDFNWITTCQRFEYITGQNFEKLAFNGMGCVIVVPGAIGCFKTKDVLNLGGYKEDTLAEDTNLTIELLRTGKVVRYEPDALCYTEAPDTLQQFYKQRFRWAFGTFQVAWKNKHLLFNPKYGSLSLFALPYMVFGLTNLIFLPLTSIGVIMFLIRMLLSGLNLYNFTAFDSKSTAALIILFVVFTTISMLRILYAIVKDKSQNKYQMFLAYPIIVTVYNLLISYVTIRAFFACIKGQRQGWGHLVRKGSLNMNQLKQKTT
jgi:cellulose synthase/poly-beta-1,6-N-acetylglucosamine synthase-like glycosyltransferase/peptidoglycan/xylan/chitin deacetylase (PgdA/CDA1 family)